YQANESLARVQENVRFALNELQFNARGATTLGFCGNRPEVNQFLNLTDDWQGAVFGLQSPVVGWEYAGTGRTDSVTVDAGYASGALGSWRTRPRQADGSNPDVDLPALFADSATIQPVADSDIFVTRTLTPIPGVTFGGGAETQGDAAFELDLGHGMADGDLALITDCGRADFFRNRTTGTTLSRAGGGGCDSCPGNLAGALNWSTNLVESMQIYRVQIWGYFVGFNSDRNEPGLYRIDLSSCPCGTIEEVVEGVENMQVLFGYSLPAPAGDGQTIEEANWLTADDMIDWWPVIAARVSLLQRSSEFSGTDNLQTEFNLAGTFVTNPLDSRMRHDASTVLAFRNRIIVDD
ncbi:MAG: PilW family protein, partial [Pseudomonadota bacterium]